MEILHNSPFLYSASNTAAFVWGWAAAIAIKMFAFGRDLGNCTSARAQKLQKRKTESQEKLAELPKGL